MIKLAAYPLVILCMSACSLTPEVPSSNLPAAKDAWPQLLPLAELAAMEGADRSAPETAETEAKTLDTRVAALRARAARLNSPVLTNTDRQRLEDAVSSRQTP